MNTQKKSSIASGFQNASPWDKSIKKDELDKAGGPLIAMLMGRAQQLGQTGQEMALDLGITYGFIGQLKSGVRQTCNIDDLHLSKMAEYLGVPRVVVLLASGKLQMEDFFEVPEEITDGMLNAALATMAQDPVCAIALPKDAHSASHELKVYLVTLYEAATGRRLLRSRWFPAEAVEFLDRVVSGKESSKNPVTRVTRPAVNLHAV